MIVMVWSRLQGSDQYAPNEEEQLRLTIAFTKGYGSKIPRIKQLSNITKTNLPDQITMDENTFIFRNIEGKIIFIQQRMDDREGGKAYLPWTYWTDNKWRNCEPDGKLPLYNLSDIKKYSTVFIHEGAKTAKKWTELIDTDELIDHPWGEKMTHAAHLAWIGGALNPLRTDWSELKRNGVTRAYLVLDNDWPGKSAAPIISQQLDIPTFSIEFTDQFPVGFDLADDFPKWMFKESDGYKYYIGPQFEELIHPATWATDLIEVEDSKKPMPVIRDSFRSMWAYVEEANVLVCREMPQIIRSEDILNKMLAPYSHVPNTSKLIIKGQIGRSAKLAYRPDIVGLTLSDGETSAINTHVPVRIRAQEGDLQRWFDFLEYLIPSKKERIQVERWVATLIAKPEVRIGYALLMVTQIHGIGKTTLGEIVLAPLVGLHNASFPNENDILSDFNEWIAHKRLAVIHEIYTGASWKSYNVLKSSITDKMITINRKYLSQYRIDNWCHIFACSNSLRALKIENSDRRWYYPKLNEDKWPSQKHIEFRGWIDRGGLSVIKWWAENYGDYIHPSEHAPMTESKEILIEESYSEACQEAIRLAKEAMSKEEPITMTIGDVRHWLKSSGSEKVFESNAELRSIMMRSGLRVWEERMRIGKRLEHVLMNEKAWEKVRSKALPDDKKRRVKEFICQPSDILEANL